MLKIKEKVSDEVYSYKGQVKDNKSFTTTTSKPQVIETKVIKYETEGNALEINSMRHIGLPFFTRRSKARKVNFVYEIRYLGLKMYCSISSEKDLQIKQPGAFEESIYNYLVQELYKRYKEEEPDDVEKFVNNTYIIFELRELIDGLGLKYNNVYSTRVKNAMDNLSFTSYRFEFTNVNKAKEVTSLKKQAFFLIDCDRFIENKKTHYKVRLNNPVVMDAFQRKLVLHFTEESMKELQDKTKALEKIYKFISMKRFSKTQDSSNLQTIASVVPYELTRKTKLRGKDYLKDETKTVYKRIGKHFEKLASLGYLKAYEIREDVVHYEFCDSKLGLVTGDTLKLHYGQRKLLEPNINSRTFKKISAKKNENSGEVMSETLKKAINKAKKNIFISKSWNKRAENKVLKLVKEESEAYTISLLNHLYKNLKTEIKTTLVQYINWILKENIVPKPIETKSIEAELLRDEKDVLTVFDAGSIVEAETVEVKSETMEKLKSHEKSLTEEEAKAAIPKKARQLALEVIYAMYNQEEKDRVEEAIKEIYLKTTNSKSFNDIHKKIFKSMRETYLVDYIIKKHNIPTE